MSLNELTKVSWECVHFLPLDKLQYLDTTLKSSDIKIIYRDMINTMDKKIFFEEISQDFNFPDYFGFNWDALEECLKDLDWLKAEGYIYIILNANYFWKNNFQTASQFLTLWLSIAEEWGKYDIPFHLVFVV